MVKFTKLKKSSKVTYSKEVKELSVETAEEIRTKFMKKEFMSFTRIEVLASTNKCDMYSNKKRVSLSCNHRAIRVKGDFIEVTDTSHDYAPLMNRGKKVTNVYQYELV